MDLDLPVQPTLRPSSPPRGQLIGPGYLITDLPTEIIQMIAKELLPTVPAKRCKDLNSLSQTCCRLRSVAYPMINRHLWFDEETQYPDTMLNIVNYSFTDPLVEFVKSATFRLRAEDGYWLRLTDTDNDIIKMQLKELREHLKRKAEEGIETFQFFESQLEEYGIATLATILLYQLKDLQEIELACSINATSTRFMLTTLHHFDPPFQLERLGMVRLVDFATANYLLLERFLRLGVPKVGIDSRFASTSGAPKIRPVSDFPSDVGGTDGTPESMKTGYQDSISIGSIESEYKIDIPFYTRIENTLARTVEQEIDQDYNGYQALDYQASGYETAINYDPLGANPTSENEDPLLIRDLRLWLDETPLLEYEPLVPLLQKARGICNIEVNLFPSVQVFEHANISPFNCLAAILHPQMETLDTLTIRISWLNAPQPEIPSLRQFDNLRRVHLFYGRDTHRRYIAHTKTGESYFKYMFPPGLKYLRVDIFKYNPCIDFITEAIDIPTAWFPNLRIVLGIAKERISDKVTRIIGGIWTSLLYYEDPVSGEWKTGIQSRSGDTSWRRTDMKRVPIQILAHGNRHRDVFCSEEGWHGPFQQHVAADNPYSSRDSSSQPSSNESGVSEPQGGGVNAWSTKPEEPEVIEVDP
ncbi:uncharacterized protein DFL_001336 [Arthrobotrys flagrans]|uniref:F-box domain-containing protein n=1 Tax=Arthrobotrys flagrans TaxID=97331 RepID=A0A437AGV3_ARTFL|nr:hypothetical protein DFL_001336 [Arthrobotrys flagrans]